MGRGPRLGSAHEIVTRSAGTQHGISDQIAEPCRSAPRPGTLLSPRCPPVESALGTAFSRAVRTAFLRTLPTAFSRLLTRAMGTAFPRALRPAFPRAFPRARARPLSAAFSRRLTRARVCVCRHGRSGRSQTLDQAGMTPLVNAVLEGSTKSVEFLLSIGASTVFPFRFLPLTPAHAQASCLVVALGGSS